MFKIGDRVKLSKDVEGWEKDNKYRMGDYGTIKARTGDYWLVLMDQDSKPTYWYMPANQFELVDMPTLPDWF